MDLYRFQEDIILYASWINDELKREKISTHAATYLGVSSGIILSIASMMVSLPLYSFDVRFIFINVRIKYRI